MYMRVVWGVYSYRDRVFNLELNVKIDEGSFSDLELNLYEDDHYIPLQIYGALLCTYLMGLDHDEIKSKGRKEFETSKILIFFW